jgi:hypothetical protein
MSEPSTNLGHASTPPERKAGWINEFERVYLLGTAKTCGGLPRQGGTSSKTGLKIASGAALVGVIACSALSFGVADGRAEDAAIGVASAAASSEVTCIRSSRRGAKPVLMPGSRRAESAAFDGKISEIPIWKTITLGTYDSAESLRRSVHCYTGRWARAALATSALTVSPSKREIDLVVLSVAALGFDEEGASLAAIHARAAQLGLELCPVEVAAQLRIQYLDQPIGELLRVAVEPVVTNDGELVTLTVANGGAGPILISGHASPDFIMPSAARFVFIRPR